MKTLLVAFFLALCISPAEAYDDWLTPMIWNWVLTHANPTLIDHEERIYALEGGIGYDRGPALYPVVVGDSWSAGTSTWPNHLAAVSPVQNYGVVGKKLTEMQLELDDYLDANPTADLLIIQGGVNDVLRGDPVAGMINAVRNMVANAKSRNNIQTIILMGPTPYNGHSSWTQEEQYQLDAYRQWMPEFCREQAILCYDTYADVSAEVNENATDDTYLREDWRRDYLHLTGNGTGNKLIARRIDSLIMAARLLP